MPNDFVIFLTAGFVILVVMLIFFGGGIPTTQPHQLDSYGMGIHRNVSGAVLVGPEDVNAVTTYDININTSYTRGKTTRGAEGKELFNGLLFGSNSLAYHMESDGVESLEISFDVVKTNSYAPLIIRVNDEIVKKKGFAVGEYTILVDEELIADEMTIEFVADSSTWKIWAPAIYGLENIKFTEKSYFYQPNEFKFMLKEDEYRTFKEGKLDLQLDENAGNLIVKMNDNPVYSDVVSDYQSLKFDKNELRVGENVLQIKADVNSRFSGTARMVIFHETQTERLLEVLLNITETEYNMLERGKIGFDIVDISQGGGLAVKILAGSTEMFSEYGTVEERSYTYYFDKSNVRAGLNRVIIQSVDDAAFSVYDFEVEY